MEHSRLLKFLTEPRYKTIMAEPPSIKVHRDYETPANITAEVPGEQKIREIDSHYRESTEDVSTSSDVTDTDTLSPVITVTKTETSLTKGDLKLQKVTVSEDIAIQEMENGGHRISYTAEKTTAQADRETVTRTVSTTESREVAERASTSEEKNADVKKSRIPLVKFKQTVEKVQKERQRNMKDQPHNKRRRSSIPKLKDAKAVKRRSSLKIEQKLDDEFEKLYEEVIDSKQSGVDDKILAINVDDPEKVETKFEEIIHAYDNNDDNYFTPSEKIKLSKIPWKKKDNSNKTGVVNKTKTTVTNSKLQDGGFKVSANTITTKRFSRGNSMDLSKSQKLDVVETSIERSPKDNEVIKVTTATEIFGENPEKANTAIHVIKRATSLSETDGVKMVRKMDNIQDNYEEKMEIEEIENGRKITKTITRIPIKPERVNRSISRELNRRPASLDDRDFVNREVVKHEEFKDGTSKTIIRETVIKEPQIRTEKITRNISRTFSRDGKSITLLSKNRQSYNEDNKNLSTEDNDKFNQTPRHDVIQISNQNALKDKKYTKDSTKLSTPIITKTTHSYIKGNIKNIERSKSVEWKAADEVITKKYSRTYSENKSTKHEIDDQKPEAMIEEKKAILDDIESTTSPIETQSDEFQSSVRENNADKKCLQTSNDIEEPFYVLTDSTNTSVLRDQEEFDPSLNSFKSSQETINRTSEKNQNLPSQEEINNIDGAAFPNKNSNIQNVTILRGNVNRLITQLSVKDTDLSKKDIEAEKELPKEKSVLSKIAMFEGKGAEHTIKVKKCSLDKKPTTLSTTDNIKKETNSVDNIYITQPELDYLNNNVYVPNGSYIDTEKISFNDDPVIVDQIMKYQEENISTIHQVQEVKILPEAIDFTVSESNVEIIENFPETNKYLSAEITVKSNENYTQQIALLPEKLDFIHSEEQTEDSQMLTDKIKYETTERQPDTTLSLPANINVIPRDDQSSIFKYSLRKNDTANADNEKKAQTPKVGKLNLDLWNKQVQVNKQLVTKGKSIEPSQIKSQTITTTKVAYEKELIDNEVPKKLETQSESTLRSDVDYTSDTSKSEISILLPGQVKIKSEGHPEMPTILAVRREFKSNIKLNETPKLLPERIDFATNEGQLQVPVILPETPLTVSTKLKFESQKSEIEVPVTTSYTTEFKTNIYIAETTNIIQNTNTSEVPKTMSGYNAEEHSIETPQTLPDEIDIVTDETGFAKIKLLPERIDFKTPGDEENITKPVPVGKFNLNPYIKVDKSNEKFPKLKHDIDLDKEIPSDPELVDSEPEIRDTKDTIMGKLKNKVFLITNRNANKNKAAHYTEKSSGPTTPSSVEDYTNKTALYPVSYENTVSKNNFEITNNFNSTKNRDQNNIHEFNVEYESREDIKRTKSLAELDLGDAVKGQVQRMVYRIKSVDFDRIETSKARKISLREMPKKSSVLEKIALFEGKANSPTTSNPRPVDIATTSKNLTQPSNQSLTEEMYLRKIEDLSTVKMRYSKTEMLYLSLGNGDQMPAIALGTALFDPRLASHIVSAAIDLGYRAIDTAFIYGTEQLVGQGIKKKIDDGTVTRGELFIMGKLWSTFHKPELVETACRASLDALGLDYFDLYMIHNPMSLKEGGDPIPQIANVLQFSQYDYMDAWFAMEALVSKGLVKAIGVSNFNSQQIQKILDKGHIKPLVNQVECHPYLTQQPLQAFCRDRNITLSCFSVLGSKGTPAEYKTAVASAIDDPLVKVMASGLNVTPAQLLVRYQIQSGRQAVVKATTPGHLYDILQALTFVLEPNQIDAINALNRNKRMFDLKKFGELHKNYPFNVPF